MCGNPALKLRDDSAKTAANKLEDEAEKSSFVFDRDDRIDGSSAVSLASVAPAGTPIHPLENRIITYRVPLD
jgi:hypothetical protein